VLCTQGRPLGLNWLFVVVLAIILRGLSEFGSQLGGKSGMIRMAGLLRSQYLGFVLLALVAFAGCSSGGSTSGTNGEGGKKFRIAVIPKGTSHEFWYSVHAGAKKADEEFDEIEITWRGPQGEGDTSQQIELVENFIADGYDGICLAPLDAVALRDKVDEAIAAGIPVVIFDSGLQNMEGVTSFVATNNYRGGQRAGEYMAELLDGEGKVILMRYMLNSLSTEQREAGFLDALKEHEGIEFLSKDRFAGADEADAIQEAEQLLSNYGDEVDGIFCPNQSTASGMLTVLKRDPRNLTEKVKLIGFDAGPNIAEGLKEGTMKATVLQNPVLMGYDSVRVMYEHLQGKEVPAEEPVAEELATTENLDDPQIHSLLYPEVTE